ncbi:MAG: isopentenyl-diphosphate delta-isomerase [Chitinophagales bacterium]|nr:MAG: isopentenyl-diphosphate delta-isomerase [Chitinophagales bacterium]
METIMSVQKNRVQKEKTTEKKTSARKKDHITLAFKSQLNGQLDTRFFYEPVLSAHPEPLKPITFLGKTMKAPLWISSMTGGTVLANKINRNLALACREFGLGMGLGSCRILLEGNSYFDDFNLRSLVGDDRPFYANLGIAQVEACVRDKKLHLIDNLVVRLQADGLIIHINPLQEWLQPEGDKIQHRPLDTIKALLEKASYKVIVKEVGQGMGPQSLRELFRLPLAAVDFAAHGGTNFSKVELLRSKASQRALYDEVAYLGHDAAEMVNFTNQILQQLGKKALCREVIISGGIKSFLDGYYLINRLQANSVYGQGSALLEHARNSYEQLRQFIAGQIKGLELAYAYLKVRQ